jgi:3-oxoacyl-[acyl-carrier protein] reductase
MQTLRDRTCVFAGATGVLGQGAVQALAEGGMNVVMVTHCPERAEKICRRFRDLPGRVTSVRNDRAWDEIFADAARAFGSVDAVISTTGLRRAPVPPDRITEEELDGILRHQVTAVYGMVRSAYPYLQKSRAGRVILLSCAGAENGFPGEHIADSISGGAVCSMTYALSRAWIPEGITVNCIARSGMVEDQVESVPGAYCAEKVRSRIPAGRPGTPEEFGALTAYIASEEAGFVTGQVFSLCGGLQLGERQQTDG